MQNLFLPGDYTVYCLFHGGYITSVLTRCQQKMGKGDTPPLDPLGCGDEGEEGK